MQDKTPRLQREKYEGRFSNPADSAPPRAYAPVRPRTSAGRAASESRPSGFATPEFRRHPPEKPAAPAKSGARNGAKGDAGRKRAGGEAASGSAKRAAAPSRANKSEPRNKRSRSRRRANRRLPLIVLAALIALVILLILIFHGSGGTFHELPTIERDGESTYVEQTAVPDSGASVS